MKVFHFNRTSNYFHISPLTIFFVNHFDDWIIFP